MTALTNGKFQYQVRYDSWYESFIDSMWSSLRLARQRKQEFGPRARKKITILQVVTGKQCRPGVVVE